LKEFINFLDKDKSGSVKIKEIIDFIRQDENKINSSLTSKEKD